MPSPRLLPLLALALFAACGPETLTDPVWPQEEDSADQDLRRHRDAGVDAGTADAGTADAGVIDVCSMTSPRAKALDTYAFPGAGERPFLDVVNGARRSLRVMVYQLTSPAIREAIRAKAAAGLDVKVILDAQQQGVNQTTFNTLTAAGAQVHWSDPAFTYTHAKFTVADDAVAIVSTGNYDSYVNSGRNFAAVDRDALDVRGLAALFDADWVHVAPTLDCTRLVVSPNNARARHLELLRAAKHTLVIESMQFSDSEIRQAVLARKQAGVAVRVLLASPSWVSANQSAGAWLVSQGIEARWRSSPAVHVKTIVVDGATAFLGSENLSRTSLSYNREVGLVTLEADDVTLITTTFEQDWATATRF